MKYLSLPALLILLCLNVCADEGIVRSPQESSNALQLMTKHQVLDEIERLKSEIDQLTSTGHISSSVALSVSAVLATIANSVTFTGLAYLLHGRDFDLDVKRTLTIAVASFFPGLGLGALLGVSNSEPYIQPRESFWLSFTTAIASTGLWLLGYKTVSYIIDLTIPSDLTLLSGFYTMPFYMYLLYCKIIHRIEGRKQKVFDLEFRLKEARNHLRTFEGLSFKNQDPGISPHPL